MPARDNNRKAGNGRRADLIVPPPREKPAQTTVKKPEFRPAGVRSYLVLFLLALLVFSPMLGSPVLWPEHDTVERSGFHAVESWAEAWTPENLSRYDPLSITSYFLEKALPFPPGPTHRTINLVLHLGAAFLCIKLFELFKVPGAFAAGLVFAIHPATVPTLFWPGYRPEIVALLFLLGTLYLALRNEHARDYTLAILLAALGAVVHPALLTLPILLALFLFYQHRNRRPGVYNKVLPFLCISIFLALWIGPSAASGNGGREFFERINQGGHNLIFLLGQALAPFDPALFHPPNARSVPKTEIDLRILPLLLLLPLFLLILTHIRERWSRGLLLGLGSFLLLALPGIADGGTYLNGGPAQEAHHLYLALPPILGLIILGGAQFLLHGAGGSRALAAPALGLLLLIEAPITTAFAYNTGDPESMWRRIHEKWPGTWPPKAALIDLSLDTDDPVLNQRELRDMLEELLELNPGAHEYRLQLARIYRETNEPTNARRAYQLLLSESEPSDEVLREAADFFESIGLSWEADRARDRIGH